MNTRKVIETQLQQIFAVYGLLITLEKALNNSDENNLAYADCARAGKIILDSVTLTLDNLKEQLPKEKEPAQGGAIMTDENNKQPSVAVTESIPNLRYDINKQRQRLMGICSVINMCRYACASKYVGLDPEEYYDALKVVLQVVGNVAGELEVIGNHWPDIDDDDIDDDD